MIITSSPILYCMSGFLPCVPGPLESLSLASHIKSLFPHVCKRIDVIARHRGSEPPTQDDRVALEIISSVLYSRLVEKTFLIVSFIQACANT